jgi:cytidylate kinase
VKSASETGLHIAIDGPAASGKTTLGSAIADVLGFRFLDTGKMYRAVTLKALQEGVASNNEAALLRIAQEIKFDFAGARLLIDGSPEGQQLHSPDVDSNVSEVSAHPSVRSVLVRRQRELANGAGIVMVGRDIGTTVLPAAPVKLWLTASEAERARRRLHDEPEHLARAGHEAALVRLGTRDRIDSTRSHSPLQKAPDAIIVNTDGKSPRQVLDQALAAIRVVSTDGPS